jgi:circadian clock protein KaiC
MLGGKGFYRGSTILASGTAGTGKTSLAAHFVEAACRRGERCLYFSFEESPGQLLRNWRSIGLDLQSWVNRKLLQFHSSRATLHGLEMHLVAIHKAVQQFQPKVVVVDPVGSLIQAGTSRDAHAMLIRLIDSFKVQGITAFLTNLTSQGDALETTHVQISSLVDTWLLLRDIELAGERNRAMYVLKSRGMAHSNQLREFLLTDHGLDLLDVYVGPGGVLTGSSRISQEARERAEEAIRQQEAERRRRDLQRKSEALEARILALRKEFEAEREQYVVSASQEDARERGLAQARESMATSRKADRSADQPVRRRRLEIRK